MAGSNIVQKSQEQREVSGQYNKCHNLSSDRKVFGSQFTQPLKRRSWVQYDKISLQHEWEKDSRFPISISHINHYCLSHANAHFSLSWSVHIDFFIYNKSHCTLLLLDWHPNKICNGKNTKPGEDNSLMQYAKPKHSTKTLAKLTWKTLSHLQFNSLNIVEPIPLSSTQCVMCVMAYIILYYLLGIQAQRKSSWPEKFMLQEVISQFCLM